MQLKTLQFTEDKGWNAEIPAELDSNNTLLIVFGGKSESVCSKALGDLHKNFPLSSIVGCSTSGEVFGNEIFDNSVSAAVLKFERSGFKIASQEIEKIEDSRSAGENLAKQLNHDGLRAVFVLATGLTVNGDQLVVGLSSGLPEGVPITGGIAGDGTDFSETCVVSAYEKSSKYIVAVGFYGDAIQFAHGSKGGWDIFGLERTVTRSEGNIVYELDGKPALDLYKEYLGERAKQLPASALLFPLSMRRGQFDEKRLVRTVLNVDEDAKSIIFGGDLPENSLVQLMRANFDRLIDGAADAAESMIELGQTPSDALSIAISCVGRRIVLGERCEEELEAVTDVLPKGIQQIGFYSYGEISPFAAGTCDLHNQTMTLTTISEK